MFCHRRDLIAASEEVRPLKQISDSREAINKWDLERMRWLTRELRAARGMNLERGHQVPFCYTEGNKALPGRRWCILAV